MLIVGRKKDQKIIIADNIELTVLEIGRNRVRFGIKAPKDVSIHTRLQELPVNSTVEVAAEPVSSPSTPDHDGTVPTLAPKLARRAAGGGRGR
jgi:carbon storage regulator